DYPTDSPHTIAQPSAHWPPPPDCHLSLRKQCAGDQAIPPLVSDPRQSAYQWSLSLALPPVPPSADKNSCPVNSDRLPTGYRPPTEQLDIASFFIPPP